MGSSGKYILMNDIDLSGVDWTAKTLNAGAEFDGNGYTISNLTINSTANNQGLFSQNSGTIKNLNIINANITGAGAIGILAGTNNSKIENCSVSGTVFASSSSVWAGAGGLVGSNGGSIKNVSVYGNVIGKGYVGGVTGMNMWTGTSVENAYSAVKVFGETRVAGLVGENQGSVLNSSAVGDIKGGSFIGGAIGYNVGSNPIVENSSATGNVSATTSNCGGFIGNNNKGTIKNSFSTGRVECNDGSTGGFVGATSGTIENSYSIGIVKSTNSNAGAFVGNNGQNSKNCIANSEQPSNIKINQTGVTTLTLDEMKDINTYIEAGWDISLYSKYGPPETAWFIKDGLPQLAHEWEQPEFFIDIQVGANSGTNNIMDVVLGFAMNDFYGDVTSVDNASATLERVDAFKERLSEHRSMIGSVRNRLDSVLESQSIRLENLNSSHSTIVDTDFASETAALTRNQILQQATSSLLSQANFMPNIALSLLQ